MELSWLNSPEIQMGVDNERLIALCKARAGYGANVTNAYNRLIHYIDNEPNDLAE